jgi:hypothetical protein
MPSLTLAGSGSTKLMPAPFGVAVTPRPGMCVQLAPASVLLNRPFQRVPTNSTSPLPGSTARRSPLLRPMPLPWVLNWRVVSVTDQVLP